MPANHDHDAFDPARHLISDRDLHRLAMEMERAERAFHVHGQREQLAATSNDNARADEQVA